MVTQTRQDDVLLPSKAVKERLGGISDMTLWRWERNSALAFPTPVVINRRKYWRLRDILDFQNRQSRSHQEA